jgi:IS605 OrfB family transposase
MNTQTLTLKLPFLNLNGVKSEELSRLTKENVALANRILAYPKDERRRLTTAAFPDTMIGSAWVNQTIRNANAATKIRRFHCLPLETNNQNWSLHKVGETYSISFGLWRGVKKRVPLEVHVANHGQVLDAVLDGTAKKGSIKIFQSRKGTWYALLSVTVAVSETAEPTEFVGIDRGQRHLAVGATKTGRSQFWSCKRIQHIRRHYANLRSNLQASGKHKMVKRLANREARIIQHINHCLSKEIVRFAAHYHSGIRLEELSGIRKAPQRKSTKRDAGKNRDFWPYYDLEQKIRYKANLIGVSVETIPAPYTSQTCNHCGAIGKRNKEMFSCQRCGYQGHADHNAARNIGSWVGAICHLPFEIAGGGLYGPAPNRIRERDGNCLPSRKQEAESHTL